MVEIPGYRLLDEVARGGMSTIYRARPEDGGEPVAIKVMAKDLAASAVCLALFDHERRILGSLATVGSLASNYVTRLFDHGITGNRPYLVLELLRGLSLQELTESDDAPGDDLLLLMLAEACAALGAIHNAEDDEGRKLHIVHRDLSPSNIHVGFDGRTRILDFGIATDDDRLSLTTTDETRGTLEFSAPEQLHREVPIDWRTDIWAMATIARTLITGSNPFRHSSEAMTSYNIQFTPIDSIAAEAPDLTADIVGIIDRANRKTPGQRPAHMDELALAFRGAHSQPDTKTRIREYMKRIEETHRD